MRPCGGRGPREALWRAEHGGEAQVTPQRLTARGRAPLPTHRKESSRLLKFTSHLLNCENRNLVPLFQTEVKTGAPLLRLKRPGVSAEPGGTADTQEPPTPTHFPGVSSSLQLWAHSLPEPGVLGLLICPVNLTPTLPSLAWLKMAFCPVLNQNETFSLPISTASHPWKTVT